MDIQKHPQIILGCGYVGRRLARLISAETRCIGITRTLCSAEAAADVCSQYLAVDLDSSEYSSLPNLRNSAIFYLAPPPNRGKTDPRLSTFLKCCAQTEPPKKIVYISTSGVYGDCKGEWVTEDQPLAPISDRACRRADAEKQLSDFSQQYNTSLIILRVGGIYGPGRIPIARASQSIVICPDQAPFTNRIHADDLATICLAAMRSEINDIFNVSDGHPTTMTDYFYQITDRAGMPRPECVSLDQAAERLSPGMLSFVRESRRLDTTRLQNRLTIKIRYPNLASGLDSCAQDFAKFQPTPSSD